MTRSAGVRAAVLGSPINHSKSPQLHTAAYRFLGVDSEYTRIELTEAEAADFLRASAAQHTGFSVTMPLKSVMVDQMTTVSDRVRTLGVLNTIAVEHAVEHRSRLSDGEAGLPGLHGENTDVDGITAALGEAGLTLQQPGGPHGADTFAVIGAGGTAAAAMAAAAELGFTAVRVYARAPERAASVDPLAHRLGLEAEVRRLDQLAPDLSTGRIAAVVSTLPPRAADSVAADISAFHQAPPLLDVAYDPWPSALAKSWRAAGGTVVSGMQMLLHQAVKQVELFTASTSRPAGELNPRDRAAMFAQMRAAVGLDPQLLVQGSFQQGPLKQGPFQQGPLKS